MKLVITLSCEGDGPCDGEVTLHNKTGFQHGLAFQTIQKDLPNLGINLDLFFDRPKSLSRRVRPFYGAPF